MNKNRVITLHTNGPNHYCVHLNFKEIGFIFCFLGTWRTHVDQEGYETADEASEAVVASYEKQQEAIA